MNQFDSIFDSAAERKGGTTALEALLPKPKTKAALKKVNDAECLREMTKCVFRSGFVWQVIENKWPGFEVAFHEFDVARCAMLSDEDVEALTRDERIVRNGTKIQAVRKNAAFVLDVRDSHGSFGKYLADWPEDDIVGLWTDLKKRGGRLGGQTGRFFLRFVGKDTPMMSQDVVKALIREGVVDKDPTSQKALAAVQDAFNTWRAESGRSHSEISRILAFSVPA